MLRFDQERALAALPRLLPTEDERREAVDIVRRIGYADGEITPESEAMLAKIERILGLDRQPGAAEPSAGESKAEPPAGASAAERRGKAAGRSTPSRKTGARKNGAAGKTGTPAP